VSLLKNIDDVCRQIREKVSVINILFQSQGTMAFNTSTLSLYFPLSITLTIFFFSIYPLFFSF
jgi:hypothetical protein